jgi:hypothetical protein
MGEMRVLKEDDLQAIDWSRVRHAIHVVDGAFIDDSYWDERKITNDFSLEPGVVAFLYYRRWGEEKYFDNFKNDLANAKAWGKKPSCDRAAGAQGA